MLGIERQAGSETKTTYIDGLQFAQAMIDAGVSREELTQKMPDVAAQLDDAVATGTDVEIPTADYATKIAATDLGKRLVDHVRLAPDALSVADAVRVERAYRDAQKAIVRGTFDPAQGRSAERFLNSVENREWAEARKVVEDRLFAQIQDAHPQFSSAEARGQAKLGAIATDILMRRAGVPVAQMDQWAPSIGGTEATHFAQQGTARFNRKADDALVDVIYVDPKDVPHFSKIRDLTKWLKAAFQSKREVTIRSTGQVARFTNNGLSASAKRADEDNHQAAYPVLEKLVEAAEYENFEPADAGHKNLYGQDVYLSALLVGDQLYSVRLKLDVPTKAEQEIRRNHPELSQEDVRYKDHKLTEIEIAPVLSEARSSQDAENSGFLVRTTELATDSKSNEKSPLPPVLSVRLGILRGAVKPTKLENGVLSQIGQRGFFTPEANAISLTPDADLSTFSHELGH